MNVIAKLIGRIIAILANSRIISYEQAEWILEPAREAVKVGNPKKTGINGIHDKSFWMVLEEAGMKMKEQD